MSYGHIFVISAASGAGKSSLVKELCNIDNNIKLSVSYTTRPQRNNEIDGRDYYFINYQQFNQMLLDNNFIEYAKVYDNYYGTSKFELDNLLANGYDVILEIDWQGAVQIKKLIPNSILIYIMPPSIAELKNRLISRGTDSEEIIAKRIAQAKDDISHANKFEYIIHNDNFHKSSLELYSIILSYRNKFNKKEFENG